MFYVIFTDEFGGRRLKEFFSQDEAENFVSGYLADTHGKEVRDFTVIQGEKMDIAVVDVVKQVRFKERP